ncbi:MAG: DMT family transporter [Chloroflexi bacterium]|nr:DMT family transporter [Chloroflexota bacterium]
MKPKRSIGMTAALLTPLFMGFAPIFGKLALNTGLDAYTLAAIRTVSAAAFLWVVYLLFFRKYIFIFPAGLLFTAVVGAINGFGSLLYYNGLFLLDDASLVQLLQMLYVIFAVLLIRLYGGAITRLSIVRAMMALLAVYLLTIGAGLPGSFRMLGVGLMIGSALLYALHVVLSQRVMFEMPAPTMALYALTSMGIVVLAARLIYGSFYPLPTGPAIPIGWLWIGGLALVTGLSRVTLFAGVRSLGALQTILLNMAEIGVTLLAGYMLLDERMTLVQWIGVAILMASVLLSHWDKGGEGEVYQEMAAQKSASSPSASASLARARLARLQVHDRLFARDTPTYELGASGDR